MRWFELAKYGQIWDKQYNNRSLISCLETLYELVYKYQRITTQGFKGYPKRYENILKGLEASTRQCIQDIANILEPVFATWLQGHALLSPAIWAEDRIKQWDDIYGHTPEAVAELILTEANVEKNVKNIDPSIVFEKMDYAVKSGEAEVISAWLNDCKNELIEADLENLISDSGNEKTEDQIKEELEQYYKEMDFSEFVNTFYQDDMIQLISALSQFYGLEEILFEFMQFACFPIWYEFWQQRGIDETRDRVENAYKMILQIPNMPFNLAISSINLVINTSHQSGPMLAFISEATGEDSSEIESVMSKLSNMTDFRHWDKQLKEVGSKFPTRKKPSPPMPPLYEPQYDQEPFEPTDQKPPH